MPHIPSQPDSAALDRYFAGESTANEQRAIEQWLVEHPDERTALHVMRAGMAEQGGPLPPYDRDARVAAIVDYSVRAARRNRHEPVRGSIANARPTWLGRMRGGASSRGVTPQRAALGLAAIVLAAGAGRYLHFRLSESGVERQMSQHYATKTGQQATVELVDGSRIKLAPNTQVTVVTDPTHHTRRVMLSGEAHFEIVHDPHSAFTVQTGAVTTHVLGTTFDIRHYPGDTVGSVLVASGKVMTSSQGHRTSLTLTAGMAAQFTDSTLTPADSEDPDVRTDWLEGRLVFHDAPIPVVLATLKRWYGYDFRMADTTLTGDQITAVFRLGETTEMMALLKRVLGVRMTFDDSVVTLHPDKAARARRRPALGETRELIPMMTEVGR